MVGSTHTYTPTACEKGWKLINGFCQVDITFTANCQTVSPLTGLCSKCNEGYSLLKQDYTNPATLIAEDRRQWRNNVCVPTPRGCSDVVLLSGTSIRCKNCNDDGISQFMDENRFAYMEGIGGFCISQSEFYDYPNCLYFSPTKEGQCIRCNLNGVTPQNCNNFENCNHVS